MPTAYPGANDSFSVPSSPATTPLASAGDSTRGHTQSHQDLGDAIVALQQNVSLLSHDHSGGADARATFKLKQINTHESVDTDTGNGIHHTIGSGANQSAAGNHGHTGFNSQLYGGTARTKPYRARCIYTGTSNATLATGTDWPAAGGWSSDPDVDSGDNMFGIDGNGARYLASPVAGLYLLTYMTRFVSGAANQYLNTCYLKNSTASSTRSTAILALSEVVTPATSDTISANGAKTIRLAAGDRVFNTIAGITGSNYQLINNQLPNACSFWELTWVGA